MTYSIVYEEEMMTDLIYFHLFSTEYEGLFKQSMVPLIYVKVKVTKRKVNI